MSKNLNMIEIVEYELDMLYTERDLYFSQVKELEERNTSLELEQVKHIEILTDVLSVEINKLQVENTELKKKLEIASKVLKKCENILDTPLVISPNKDTHKEIKQALAAIKEN